MIVVTRSHEFSYGHRVYGHESKCAFLHGHNAQVEFSVASLTDKHPLDSVGRVMDFSVIKYLLCQWLEDQWDHRMLIWSQDPMLSALRDLDPTVVALDVNPTAENMAMYLVETVGPLQLIGTGVVLIGCTFHETTKCAASYCLGD